MNQNIIEHQELVKSNIATLYGVELAQFEKGGEGSKGGKVIGHTKSGKPIYADKKASHADYKDFTSDDHRDAWDKHSEIMHEGHSEKQILRGLKNKDSEKKIANDKWSHHSSMMGTHYTKAKSMEIKADEIKKSEESAIEKGQTLDAFRYSDSQAFKIELTGAEINEKCKTAIPYLTVQKNALKEIAQDALNQCEGNVPTNTRKKDLISYATFSYEQTDIKRDEYTNKYLEKTECQLQMERYNSAIYEILEIIEDIKVLQTLSTSLNNEKVYPLTLNQLVAISMGYTEDELTEKAEIVEIEKGGEGSKGGKVIGHTSSGKPIYDSANHAEHKDFDFKDHWEAKTLHENSVNNLFKTKSNGGAFDKEDIKKVNYHKKQAENHKKLIEKNNNKKGFYDSSN